MCSVYWRTPESSKYDDFVRGVRLLDQHQHTCTPTIQLPIVAVTALSTLNPLPGSTGEFLSEYSSQYDRQEWAVPVFDERDHPFPALNSIDSHGLSTTTLLSEQRSMDSDKSTIV